MFYCDYTTPYRASSTAKYEESSNSLVYPRSRSHSYFRCGQELGRVPTHTRNVYRDKTPPPVINTTYERAPTPEPDVIEKIYIKREPQQIYETIYERPKTPPPVVIEKTEVEAPPAALYTCKVVDVDHGARNQLVRYDEGKALRSAARSTTKYEFEYPSSYGLKPRLWNRRASSSAYDVLLNSQDFVNYVRTKYPSTKWSYSFNKSYVD